MITTLISLQKDKFFILNTQILSFYIIISCSENNVIVLNLFRKTIYYTCLILNYYVKLVAEITKLRGKHIKILFIKKKIS